MTYEHKYKCLKCGLHFIVYSWRDNTESPYCPECGERGSVMHWLDTSDKEIFEFVPGDAVLIALE